MTTPLIDVKLINELLTDFSNSAIFLEICKSKQFTEDEVAELSNFLANQYVKVALEVKHTLLASIDEQCDKLLASNRNDLTIIKTLINLTLNPQQ